VIAYAVWLYFKFPFSLRMVEDCEQHAILALAHIVVKFDGPTPTFGVDAEGDDHHDNAF
jgi:hypothetical protein